MSNNKEKRKAYDQAYYLANKEKRKAYQRDNYQANKEKINAYQRAYRKDWKRENKDI